METDVVVIGSGIAGLFFALEAARTARVLIVTKAERPEGSTNYAQGGIAAVFSADDSRELHVADTLAAGAGLCHPGVVELLVREGPDRVRELIELGVRFTREGGALSLGREGGHSRRRIVRADDLTGQEIERALLAAVAECDTITVLDHHFAVDLLQVMRPDSRRSRSPICSGVLVLPPGGGEPIAISARAVVLATGGCGRVYRHTTNPAVATGDGIAMAWRAGAKVANMEFVQFHPTALFPAEERSFLVSEAVRGEGAVLRRVDGTTFMEEYHRLGSLAPRDVVARAIDYEMKQAGTAHVLLDCTALEEDVVRTRFPNILRETTGRRHDMLREPIPVVPAAHYLCGGVLTDVHGRTSVPGLLAIGETACTGVHGANRLASNSLLEAVVFARRAAAHLARALPTPPEAAPSAAERGRGVIPHPTELMRDRAELRALMWDLVGIVRSDERLARAAERIQRLGNRTHSWWSTAAPDAEFAELRNLITTAALIVRSASGRKESRGLHFNLDYPDRDDWRWMHDTVLVP